MVEREGGVYSEEKWLCIRRSGGEFELKKSLGVFFSFSYLSYVALEMDIKSKLALAYNPGNLA